MDRILDDEIISRPMLKSWQGSMALVLRDFARPHDLHSRTEVCRDSAFGAHTRGL